MIRCTLRKWYDEFTRLTLEPRSSKNLKYWQYLWGICRRFVKNELVLIYELRKIMIKSTQDFSLFFNKKKLYDLPNVMGTAYSWAYIPSALNELIGSVLGKLNRLSLLSRLGWWSIADSNRNFIRSGSMPDQDRLLPSLFFQFKCPPGLFSASY